MTPQEQARHDELELLLASKNQEHDFYQAQAGALQRVLRLVASELADATTFSTNCEVAIERLEAEMRDLKGSLPF